MVIEHVGNSIKVPTNLIFKFVNYQYGDDYWDSDAWINRFEYVDMVDVITHGLYTSGELIIRDKVTNNLYKVMLQFNAYDIDDFCPIPYNHIIDQDFVLAMHVAGKSMSAIEYVDVKDA